MECVWFFRWRTILDNNCHVPHRIIDQLNGMGCLTGRAANPGVWGRHSEGPPFRRSATPKDRDETWIAGWYSLTLTLTLTITLTLGIRPIDLRPPMASLRNGGQDLRSGGPSEWRTETRTTHGARDAKNKRSLPAARASTRPSQQQLV